jgi:hypothetical protein
MANIRIDQEVLLVLIPGRLERLLSDRIQNEGLSLDSKKGVLRPSD